MVQSMVVNKFFMVVMLYVAFIKRSSRQAACDGRACVGGQPLESRLARRRPFSTVFRARGNVRRQSVCRSAVAADVVRVSRRSFR